MRQLLDQVEQITKEQAYQRVRSVECVWASMLVRMCARVDVGVAMIVSSVA